MRKVPVCKAGIILSIAIVLGVSSSYGGDLTAKVGLSKANQAAKSWHSDAALTRIGTTVLKQDGSAIVWQYDYVSPSTVTCARVILVGAGQPRIQDLGKCTPAKAISSEFVDSPVMLKAATAAGFKPDESSDAYLTLINDSALQERVCWVVHTINDFDKSSAYMRGWCVDPQTGKFVARLSGKSAAKKQ